MIVVTAQRRQELSRDVPITINTADAVQLRQANVDSLLSLSKLAPGVRIDQQGAYTQATIRGIGTTLVQTGAGASVGTYVDGFYLPNPLSINFEFLNVENVQVLKGPQGTLFGRNTTGGAILITTAEPRNELGGIVEASYERFDAKKVQGYLTGGLGTGVSASVEALWEKGDSFTRRNLYDGNLTAGPGYAPGAPSQHPGAYENWSVRAAVKAEVSDRVSFLLRYMHQDRNDPRGYMDGTYTANGIIYSAADTVPGTIFGLRRGEIATDSALDFRLNTDTIQLTGKFDLDFADLTSYTQYREEEYVQIAEGDYSSQSFLALNLPEKDKILSQELLLNSKPGSRLQYTAGIFLFQHKVDAGVLLAGMPISGSQAFFPFSATGVKVRTFAGFADATYEVASDFFVTGGLRYSRDEVKKPYYQTTPGVPGVFTFQADRKDSKLSPRVVLRYKPSEEASIYASYTKGFKSAIPDYRATSGRDYLEPEDVNAFEAGFKYGSGGLSFEGAAFYYDYKNLQNGYYTAGETILSNAGKSKIRGVEGAVSYKVGGFEISANATYLDAKYTSYPRAGFYTPNFIPDNDGDGLPEFAGFTPGNAPANGKRVQHAPKFSGTISARYTADVGGGKLVVGANLYHTSRIWFDASNQFSQGAYDILSARLEWTDPSDRVTVAVYGDNLFDEKYLTQMQVGQAGVGTVWGEPATYGVSVRYRFGAQ
ncbi:MAG: TonB-dependent receptor [Novosphingobium sp.]